MSVKAVQPTIETPNGKKYLGKQKNSNVAFRGLNPIIGIMDAIDRGGFAASFISQDGIGMVAPRIHEGLNRNRKKDENGKKTGPLNWAFARREGVREILSGPSAFLIPLGILTLIKKYSGTANNVPVDLINAYGENFVKIAAENKELLKDTAKAKAEFYEKMFKNVLSSSTDGNLAGAELDKTAKSFAERLLNIENAKSKGPLKHLLGKKVAGSRQDLTAELIDDFMGIRKYHTAPSSNESFALIKPAKGAKTVGTSIHRLITSLGDYSNDAISHLQKYIKKFPEGNTEKYIQQFNLRRSGTRVMSNFGMWLAVVGFYTIIPKLYNLGLKEDPGLKGLNDETETNAKPNEVKQPAEKTAEKHNEDAGKKSEKTDKPTFTGGFQTAAAKTGETVLNSNTLGKVARSFEFSGASMSVPAMLTLLFGFCFPPRYMNAKSNHERKEIVVRDLSSFAAILFAAKALSRAFSVMFSKITGFALNTKPEDHNKSFMKKLKNYFTPGNGIDVLNAERTISKYSNIENHKDGILGFFKFIEENDGNINKVLRTDKTVRGYAEKIVGKSLKNATSEEVKNAFANEMKKGSSELLEGIYKAFRSPKNKFINIAKTCNSAFGFLSMLVLVPAFMIWLARYCENMTKTSVEEEKETKKVVKKLTDKPSMEGFLRK